MQWNNLLDDLIVPILFILIWVGSGLIRLYRSIRPALSRPVEQTSRRPVSTASKPPQTTRTSNSQTVWELEDSDFAPDTEEDAWSWAASPGSSKKAKKLDPFEKDQEAALQKIRSLIEQRKANALKSEQPHKSASKHQNQSTIDVNLAHMLPDHAAEVHLENPFERTTSVNTGSRQTHDLSPINQLIQQLSDPNQARKAFLLSQIFGEPRAKQNVRR